MRTVLLALCAALVGCAAHVDEEPIWTLSCSLTADGTPFELLIERYPDDRGEVWCAAGETENAIHYPPGATTGGELCRAGEWLFAQDSRLAVSMGATIHFFGDDDCVESP